MSTNHYNFAKREIEILARTDSCENVIRYFNKEHDDEYTYIAVELCERTLKDFVDNSIFLDFLNKTDILQQITKGVQYLHKSEVIHRDLTPEKILISFPDRNHRIRVLISDFGFGKVITNRHSSFSNSGVVKGTQGFNAPELGNEQRLVIVNIVKNICNSLINF